MKNVVDVDFSEVDRVNVRLMERVEAIVETLQAGVEQRKDPYQILIGMLGNPIRTQFKVEFRQGRDFVVGGRMIFKGDDISRYVTIDEMELLIRGKVMGEASASFGSSELDEPMRMSQFQLALSEMFAKIYSQNKSQIVSS